MSTFKCDKVKMQQANNQVLRYSSVINSKLKWKIKKKQENKTKQQKQFLVC